MSSSFTGPELQLYYVQEDSSPTTEGAQCLAADIVPYLRQMEKLWNLASWEMVSKSQTPPKVRYSEAWRGEWERRTLSFCLKDVNQVDKSKHKVVHLTLTPASFDILVPMAASALRTAEALREFADRFQWNDSIGAAVEYTVASHICIQVSKPLAKIAEVKEAVAETCVAQLQEQSLIDDARGSFWRCATIHQVHSTVDMRHRIGNAQAIVMEARLTLLRAKTDITTSETHSWSAQYEKEKERINLDLETYKIPAAQLADGFNKFMGEFAEFCKKSRVHVKTLIDNLEREGVDDFEGFDAVFDRLKGSANNEVQGSLPFSFSISNGDGEDESYTRKFGAIAAKFCSKFSKGMVTQESSQNAPSEASGSSPASSVEGGMSPSAMQRMAEEAWQAFEDMYDEPA